MTGKQKTLVFVGLTLIVAAIIFLLIPYLVTNKTWGWTYGQDTGVIGDTIGGITAPIVGFIGIILTFFAFYIQFQANQVQINALEEQKKSALQQEKQILLQQFESNFFELLKLHRENVSELDYRNNKGRNVIIKIVNEFFEIIDDLKKSKTNLITANQLDEQDIANIAYTILFFGTDETVSDVLENRFFQKYNTMEISISCFIREELREKTNPYNADKYYFNGHQSRLGHYFRHLRRIVTFVHRNTLLTPIQKSDYMRILRAQLSNHEQIILFFNSISDLGLKWELKNDNNETLITTYNLIRNIPLGSIYGYRPKRYYPKLKMENDFEIRL